MGYELKKKIEIIAEIANSHQGDIETAYKIAKTFAGSYADAVKFQIYSAEELLVKKHPRFKHFKSQSFTNFQWDSLLKKSKRLKCKIYADVFGINSFKIAKKNNIDGYKVHSSDLNNDHLLKLLANENKVVFLSVGGSHIEEINNAINIFDEANNRNNLVILYGFQAYPTRLADTSLDRLKKIKEIFGKEIKIGYSDHISGDDQFSTILPIMSLGYEVDYIEKHVNLDRSLKGVDYYSSLNPDEFKKFVNTFRNAEKALGSKVSFSEKKYREQVKKNWVSKTRIKKNNTIQSKDLIMKRVTDKIYPIQLSEIIGKKLKKNIHSEEIITRDLFQNKKLAIIVARSNSNRLPGKALLPINGIPMIQHLFERISIAKKKGFIDTVAFCTTHLEADDKLCEIANKYKFKIYRGHVENVLSRMMLAINDNLDHETVIRITGDDILIDPIYLNKTINQHLRFNADYTDAKRLPTGMEAEIFHQKLLQKIDYLAKNKNQSEYLTFYINKNEDQINTSSLKIKQITENIRLTIDTNEDYKLVKNLLTYFKNKKKEFNYTLNDVCEYFKKNNNLLKNNSLSKIKKKPKTFYGELDWSKLTKKPLVTVYITNFNYAKYIENAINSVLNQTFQNFELIIIDDGSTDNSKKIIENFRGHPKISIVYQKNKGLNSSNNVAIKLSRANYIMRLDADDFLNENAISIMYQKLSSDDELGLVFPDYYLVDEKGSIIHEEKRHDFKKVTLFDQPAHGACTMIRKSYLKKLGGYSKNFDRQDGYELWLKMIKHKVYSINLPLFYYRRHGNNLTNNKNKLFKTRHKIIKKHINKLNIRKKKHLAILPIRLMGDDTYLLKPILNSTLVELTIKEMKKNKLFEDIVVTTPNSQLLKHIKKKYVNSVKFYQRPYNLAEPNVQIDKTVEFILKKEKSKRYDTISIINCEYPLRKNFYFENAINMLYLHNADSAISVTEENSNFYLHLGGGLVPMQTNRNLRLERESIYREIGGIHVVMGNYFYKYNKILGQKNTHIIIDNESATKINNDKDFENFKKLKIIY